MKPSDIIPGLLVWLRTPKGYEPGVVITKPDAKGLFQVDTFAAKDGEWDAHRGVKVEDVEPRSPLERRETVRA